jgi:hypothetical protein
MPTHTAKTVFVILMSLTVLGGCSASMQVVRKDARGGEIAVWGATMPAATQARHAMLEHCEGRFTVGAGAETYGLGVADPMLVSSSHSRGAALPSDAHVLTYRCAGPAHTTDPVPTAVAQYRAER